MTPPAPDTAQIRFRVDPADVPAEKAARRLHLTLDRFNEVLPRLLLRGFPAADPDTGMYDLDAIDRWRAARHRADAVPGPVSLTPGHGNLHSPAAPAGGAAERFIAAKDRQTRGRRRAVA
jgi:hypothetical protein